MREKSLCSGPNRANCSIVNGEIPEPSKKLSIWLYNSIILIADFCFFFYRLVETARLLRNVRNVFRRPNVTSDGARGQTELELSRKICWYSLFKTHLKQETVNKDHFTSMSLLFWSCFIPDGYAFSQEEHGAVRQGDMVRAYDTTLPSRFMDKL